jgi:hypothetical protein
MTAALEALYQLGDLSRTSSLPPFPFYFFIFLRLKQVRGGFFELTAHSAGDAVEIYQALSRLLTNQVSDVP